MSSARAEGPPVGVKMGGFFTTDISEPFPHELGREVDFVEYGSPVLDLRVSFGSRFDDLTFLRPHSVFISTAWSRAPSRSVLKRLAAECRATACPYLGEHIGLLNPAEGGPSLGYLYPPPLSRETAANVARHVREIEDECGVPVALENPVFYQYPEGSEMNWEQFISALSELLPPSTGWLIDVAHLTVSARNLGVASIVPWVEAYARTGRPVYEAHFAGLGAGEGGVAHDNHRARLDEAWLRAVLSAFEQAGVSPANYTVEFDGVGDEALRGLRTDVKLLRRLLGDADHGPSGWDFGSGRRPSSSLLAEAERRGRLRILGDRVLSQLRQPVAAQASALASEFGFSDFYALIREFAGDQSIKHPGYGVPYFSDAEADGSDLTGPFYEFLRRRCDGHEGRAYLARHVLVQVAIKSLAAWKVRNGSEQCACLLEVKGPFAWGGAGRYQLNVDTRNRIIIIPLSGTAPPPETQIRFVEGESEWIWIPG